MKSVPRTMSTADFIQHYHVNNTAVSMTKCKKRSMMLPEIKSVRGEQLRGALEAQRLAWPGVQFPGNRIQFLLREATQVAALGQVLPQQAVGVLVDAADRKSTPLNSSH